MVNFLLKSLALQISANILLFKIFYSSGHAYREHECGFASNQADSGSQRLTDESLSISQWLTLCGNNNTDCTFSANGDIDLTFCYNNASIGEPLTADEGERVVGRDHSCKWTLLSPAPQPNPPNPDILGPFK